MEKYLKSIDRSMKGIHEELKKMNRRGSTNLTIDVKNDDVKSVINEIEKQTSASMASRISRGI